MVTLKQIAEKTGVSYSTVSYVLHNPEKSQRFSKKTSDKVKKVADEMGYLGDAIARSMKTGKTRTIGFLTNNTYMEFFGRILTGIIEEAGARDYSLRLLHINTQTDMKKLVNICVQQRFASIVCCLLSKEQMEFLHENLIPKGISVAVVSNNQFFGSDVHVYFDGREGGHTAFKHLYELGHRRIAHISPYQDETWSSDRREGFLEAAKDAGVKIPENFILTSPGQYENLLEQLKMLFSSADVPTAIFCNSDFTANNVLLALTKIGLNVPDDVSLVGFADLSIAKKTTPQLTTIKEPFELMGKKVIEILIDRLPVRKNKKIIEKIKVELIQRKSTAIRLK